jgi:hypothetical protein
MRTITQGKTFWKVREDDMEVAGASIYNRRLTIWVSSWEPLTASEWSSLCTWVEEKRKEGRLWKEGK